MKIPYTEEEITLAKDELIKKMNKNNCYIRPLFGGEVNKWVLSTNDADINVAIALWDDWASYFKIEDRLSRFTFNYISMEKTCT